MKGVPFHPYQDNVPAHKSVVAMATVHDWLWTGSITFHIILIWHHLTFFLFPNMNK